MTPSDRRVVPTETLVELSRLPSCSDAQRHEAFAVLVARFQDMAFGCAFAILRDRWLAEDCAQEAFLTAWQRLADLREPWAFPGWLHRLVRTQCNRLLRKPRLVLEALTAAEARACGAPDPEAGAATKEDVRLADDALAQLTPALRLAFLLAEVYDFSHPEIAAFLGVPVSTVSRRVFHARRRLQAVVVERVARGLRRHRPSTGVTFIMTLHSRVRPALGADWTAIDRLGAGTPVGNVPTHYRPPALSRQRREYVVEPEADRPVVAYGAIEQTVFAPIYELRLVMAPDWFERGAGDLLLVRLLEDARAFDAIAVEYHTPSDRDGVSPFLQQRGFVETARMQDWRCVLKADLALRTSRAGDLLNGVTITTFFTWQTHDSIALNRLLGFVNQVAAEDPEQRPFLPIAQASLSRWMQGSRLHRDTCFIALTGGEPVGILALSARDSLPGGLSLAVAAVGARNRRRGIASELLRAALEQANADTVTSLRCLVSAHRSEFIEWLRAVGFRRDEPDALTLERILRSTVTVPIDLLDAYAGVYEPDAAELKRLSLPDHVDIVVERHGRRLVSKARDMRDELFPASDSDFFVKHHYGRIRFERLNGNRASHLVYTEGPHTIHARRVR